MLTKQCDCKPNNSDRVGLGARAEQLPAASSAEDQIRTSDFHLGEMVILVLKVRSGSPTCGFVSTVDARSTWSTLNREEVAT